MAYLAWAIVALACFVVVKFMMTLHLGPIIALCFAQVPVQMRAMMSATINMFIGLAGVGLGGTVAGYLSKAFTPGYGELSLQPSLAILSGCLLIGGFAAISGLISLDAVALAGTNHLELRVYGSDAHRHALLVARLDNLGKGASGAAVQNLQLMLGL